MNKVCISCNRERVYYAKDMCKSCYNKRAHTVTVQVVKQVTKPCEWCDGIGLEKLTPTQFDSVLRHIKNLLSND